MLNYQRVYHEKLASRERMRKEHMTYDISDIRLHSDHPQKMSLLRPGETQPSLAVPFDIKLQHQRQRTVRHLALKSYHATWPCDMAFISN
jgi:hypothetical protein